MRMMRFSELEEEVVSVGGGFLSCRVNMAGRERHGCEKRVDLRRILSVFDLKINMPGKEDNFII